jgi:hypothetical protein
MGEQSNLVEEAGIDKILCLLLQKCGLTSGCIRGLVASYTDVTDGWALRGSNVGTTFISALAGANLIYAILQIRELFKKFCPSFFLRIYLLRMVEIW